MPVLFRAAGASFLSTIRHCGGAIFGALSYPASTVKAALSIVGQVPVLYTNRRAMSGLFPWLLVLVPCSARPSAAASTNLFRRASNLFKDHKPALQAHLRLKRLFFCGFLFCFSHMGHRADERPPTCSIYSPSCCRESPSRPAPRYLPRQVGGAAANSAKRKRTTVPNYLEVGDDGARRLTALAPSLPPGR